MFKRKKIAITGGPCAGKTTAMQKIVQEFTEKGYKVFVVCETATELISGGAKPFGDNPIDMEEFQNYVLDLQLAKEKIFEKIALGYKQNTIILCDRGIMDNRAYISGSAFKKLLKRRHLNEMELMDSYDLVLHLVTAADGAVQFYTCANNSARTETVEEARLMDKKTLDSWIGHKQLKIIGNESSFDDKIHNVIREIYDVLGEPFPIQKQFKFLVDKIDLKGLKNRKLVKLELEQFFVDGNDEVNEMVRKTTKDGDSTYSYTIKKNTSVNHERITTSRKITDKEYDYYFDKLDDVPIRKCRYCFTYNKQYYRLDVFEKPNNLVILETELTNMSKQVLIPEFITVKKDITDNLDYRNVNLYKKINNSKDDCLVITKD